LAKKRYRINNKKAAINTSIIVLKAKKAALRAKLCFITLVMPPLIDEPPIIGFNNTNKDIIKKNLYLMFLREVLSIRRS
jgi:hypothetical protein